MNEIRALFRRLYHRARGLPTRWLRKLESRRRAMLTRRLIDDRSSDIGRWSDPASFEGYWVERNRLLAAAIPPGASVLEFGAGMRELEKLLPPGCRYTPSDLVSRGPDTLVCDLNTRPLPEFPRHDWIVLSGVLEYLHEPEAVLAWLRSTAPAMLLSYATSDGGERDIASRRGNGFVNDFAAKSLSAMLTRAGWRGEVIGRWHGQLLLRCTADAPPADRS